MLNVVVWSGKKDFAGPLKRELRGKAAALHAVNGSDPRAILRQIDRHAADALIVDAREGKGRAQAILRCLESHPQAPNVIVVSSKGAAADSFGKRHAAGGLEIIADASQAAEALLRGTRWRRLNMEKARLERELALYKTLAAVSKDLEWDSLLTAMLDGAMELSGAAAGALAGQTGPKGRMEALGLRGLSRDATKDGVLGFSRAALKRIAGSSKAALFKPGRGGFRPALIRAKTSFCCAFASPISAGKESLGALVLLRAAGQPPFSPEDMATVEFYLREMADFLHNARVYGRAQGLTLKDDLTSAYNRRYFETYLKEEITRASRFKTKVALIFLDLDNLRQVNDRYGHFMGSRALMEAAHRIMESVRSIDKVVRFGGDEFCVVLPETDLEGAMVVAERVHRRIDARKFLLHDVDGGAVLSASLGIAVYPDHASGKEELVKRADEAMYRVKTHGKSAIAVAGETLLRRKHKIKPKP